VDRDGKQAELLMGVGQGTAQAIAAGSSGQAARNTQSGLSREQSYQMQQDLSNLADLLNPVPLADWVQHLLHAPMQANPYKGKPGSETQCHGRNGQPKQTRRYGSDGYPETDTDWDHDYGQGQPHVHDWGRPSDGGEPTNDDRSPGRPPQPGDPGIPGGSPNE